MGKCQNFPVLWGVVCEGWNHIMYPPPSQRIMMCGFSVFTHASSCVNYGSGRVASLKRHRHGEFPNFSSKRENRSWKASKEGYRLFDTATLDSVFCGYNCGHGGGRSCWWVVFTLYLGAGGAMGPYTVRVIGYAAHLSPWFPMYFIWREAMGNARA